MKRQRNRTCIYTGRVGAKMPFRKKPIVRMVVRLKFTLRGGPLDAAKVRLDATGGGSTVPLAAMKGFPPGRYINSIWTPDPS